MAQRQSEEKVGRRGWAATVAFGMVAIGLGFAVGIVAGVGWEEPVLVFDYLTGDTEEVDWSLAGSTPSGGEMVVDPKQEPPLPAVGASPPRAPIELHDEVEKAEILHRAAERAAAATEPLPGGGYSIQVGAFLDSNSAHGLVDSLRAKGYRVYVSRGEGNDSAWRVRVGPLRTRADAEKTALQLENREKLPTWVLSEGS
jgi:cell division septation protein DedD